jgi:acyl-CoA dehydrogenase
MVALIFVVACVVAVFALAIRRASIETWAIAAATAALIWQTGLIDGRFHAPTLGLSGLIGWLPAIVLGLLSISSLRRSWLTGPVYHGIKKALPRVSDTESQALEAGTIGFDA